MSVIKLTPSTMTQTGAKIVEASRELWSLYAKMEYLYYQSVDIVQDNPESPDWAALAALYGYPATEEGHTQAQLLFQLLSYAEEQVRLPEINGKTNALLAIMWKVGH